MPGFNRDVYVGSTQDGNTMRRHREHLKAKSLVGNFLRWYVEPPIPREVERVEYESVEELLKREKYWQEQFGVMQAQGGYNKVPAWPAVDHAAIGRIGGPLGGKATKVSTNGRKTNHGNGGRRKHELHPEAAAEFGKKYGVIGGKRGGKRVHELYLGKAAEWARKAGQRTRELYLNHFSIIGALGGGLSGAHFRWHVARKIVNPTCILCVPQ